MTVLRHRRQRGQLCRCRHDRQRPEKFLAILAENGYPADWLADTSFEVDSHENVERNFDGSYFYRLR